MRSLWGIQVGTLLLCGSAMPTQPAGSAIDLDHRGRASLIRSDTSSASDVSPADFVRPGDIDNVTASRYRRGPWGTMTCDTHTIPVSDELNCLNAAEALGGTYNPVGSWHASPPGCVMQKPAMIVMFVRSNGTDALVTDFPNYAKLCDTGNPQPCPTGYDKELGDTLPEWGDTVLGSYQGGIYADTVEDCKAKCNNDTRCLSFKWSPTYNWGQDGKLVCVLNSIPHPTIDRTWLDFVFCAKTTNTLNMLRGKLNKPGDNTVADAGNGRTATEANEMAGSATDSTLALMETSTRDDDSQSQHSGHSGHGHSHRGGHGHSHSNSNSHATGHSGHHGHGHH